MEFLGTVIPDWQIRGSKLLKNIYEDDLQPASLDLRIKNDAFMYQVAGVPSLGKGFEFQAFIAQYTLNKFLPLGEEREPQYTLIPGGIYIVELDVEFCLTEEICASFDTKSSLGRIDVHCLVIGENCSSFDQLPRGYTGKVYGIILPNSFPVRPTSFTPIVQVRLEKHPRSFLGESYLASVHHNQYLLEPGQLPEFNEQGLILHLDLTGNPGPLVGVSCGKPINLNASGSLDPRAFFREKLLDSLGNLLLEPGEFLLTKTHEKVSVPVTFCATMSAFLREHGDIRWHYAGFIDPGFGRDLDSSGNTLVCEVRNLTRQPIILANHQPIGVLRFQKLTEMPEYPYGFRSNYKKQREIKLAKYFKDFD